MQLSELSIMVATTNNKVIGLYNSLPKQELFIAAILGLKIAFFQVYHSLASYLQDRDNERRGFIHMSLATEPTFVDKACLATPYHLWFISTLHDHVTKYLRH